MSTEKRNERPLQQMSEGCNKGRSKKGCGQGRAWVSGVLVSFQTQGGGAAKDSLESFWDSG